MDAKGKVESGVKYVKNNGLKGHEFKSVGAENAHLAQWETHVADKRIHGTTCKQVGALFEEERAHLQPLPASLFPSYQEAVRTVGRDSFVEVARSYYEVPPEYIGNKVWARWDGRVVRIFNERREQVQMHTRLRVRMPWASSKTERRRVTAPSSVVMVFWRTPMLCMGCLPASSTGASRRPHPAFASNPSSRLAP